MLKLTQEEVIKRCKKIHPEYDYSKSIYINRRSKMEIICPIHGNFWQHANRHLNGSGCPRCSGRIKTTDEIVNNFKKIHGDKYDYSKMNYKSSIKKIEIICPDHGSFFQTPNSHLRSGCPTCGGTKKLSKLDWIKKAKLKHGVKYDYSKVNYINAMKRVEIICPKHGSFFQIAINHVNGQASGCPKCVRKSYSDHLIDFNKIHFDKFTYNEKTFVNVDTKMEIICPEHGSFWQLPSNHKSGAGCSRCSQSKGELKIYNFLKKYKVNFFSEYRFKDCRYKNSLPFDFYLHDLNMLIEYDGEQHFKPVNHFGGEDEFKLRRLKDDIKTKFAIKNNISLIRLSYLDLGIIDEILEGLLSISTDS